MPWYPYRALSSGGASAQTSDLPPKIFPEKKLKATSNADVI